MLTGTGVTYARKSTYTPVPDASRLAGWEGAALDFRPETTFAGGTVKGGFVLARGSKRANSNSTEETPSPAR